MQFGWRQTYTLGQSRLERSETCAGRFGRCQRYIRVLSTRVLPGITTVKFQLLGEGPPRLRGNLPTLKPKKMRQRPPASRCARAQAAMVV
jgi:hypothetical protein